MSSQMASREPTAFLSVPHVVFPKIVRSDLCFYSYIYDIVVCKFIDWIFHRIFVSLFSSCFYFSFILGNPRTILNLLSDSSST